MPDASSEPCACAASSKPSSSVIAIHERGGCWIDAAAELVDEAEDDPGSVFDEESASRCQVVHGRAEAARMITAPRGAVSCAPARHPVSQYFELHPDNPQLRLIRRAAEIVRDGGVIVYPTDSCYALGCHIGDKDALDRIRRIRDADRNHHFTLVCRDLAEIAQVRARSKPGSSACSRPRRRGRTPSCCRPRKETPRRLAARQAAHDRHSRARPRECRACCSPNSANPS